MRDDEWFKALRVFLQWYFKKIQRVLQGCFQEVSRLFHKKLKGLLRKFQLYFKKVSRKIEECIKGVLSGYQGYLKTVQREFQRSFKCILRVCVSRVFNESLGIRLVDASQASRDAARDPTSQKSAALRDWNSGFWLVRALAPANQSPSWVRTAENS